MSVAAKGAVSFKKWPHAACVSAMWDYYFQPAVEQLQRIEALVPSTVSTITAIKTASMG